MNNEEYEDEKGSEVGHEEQSIGRWGWQLCILDSTLMRNFQELSNYQRARMLKQIGVIITSFIGIDD